MGKVNCGSDTAVKTEGTQFQLYICLIIIFLHSGCISTLLHPICDDICFQYDSNSKSVSGFEEPAFCRQWMDEYMSCHTFHICNIYLHMTSAGTDPGDMGRTWKQNSYIRSSKS